MLHGGTQLRGFGQEGLQNPIPPSGGSLSLTSWPMASLIQAGGLRTASSPTDQHALLHTERNSGSKLACTASSRAWRWGCKCVTAHLATSPSSANPLWRTSGIACVRHLPMFYVHTHIHTRIFTYIHTHIHKCIHTYIYMTPEHQRHAFSNVSASLSNVSAFGWICTFTAQSYWREYFNIKVTHTHTHTHTARHLIMRGTH